LLPTPRGDISSQIIEALRRPAGCLPLVDPPPPTHPLSDEDLHLALYVAYELHYRGFDGVDERWEWEPALLGLRARLEREFEHALLDTIGPPSEDVAPAEMDLALRAIADADEGPSVSAWIERDADVEQVREFAVHRSAYQLKEADPHSWALPRLSGRPKAALVEIQADEYGGGRAERIHAQLFAKAMAGLGLDPAYGAYLDHIPGVTLATVNVMSLFGLHRRHRGAIVGHLALFEMTSSIPNGRYARGLRRLGFEDETIDFFDEHVEADAVHENVAAVDLAGGLARMEPTVAPSVLWGARALALLDARWSAHVVERWDARVSSLRMPLREAAAAA
jgi:hypothetical protein